MKMKEKVVKSDYASPIVEVMSVRVESGMQTSSNGSDNSNVSTNQYGSASWDSPNPNNRYS